MSRLKHIGKIMNTGAKCVVVFKEMYDGDGVVTDNKSCLVIETDRLPDADKDNIMQLVESTEGQAAMQFYEIAHKHVYPNGTTMLQAWHERGYLKKHPTNKVYLTPDNMTAVPLSEINFIIRSQSKGMSEKDIMEAMKNDPSLLNDNTSHVSTIPVPNEFIDAGIKTNMEPISDVDLAKSILKQSEGLVVESQRLKDQAYDLAPELRPVVNKAVKVESVEKSIKAKRGPKPKSKS